MIDVTFSKPATYQGRKEITVTVTRDVSARQTIHGEYRIIQVFRGGVVWEIEQRVDHGVAPGDPREWRRISKPRSLRETKKLMTQIINGEIVVPGNEIVVPGTN